MKKIPVRQLPKTHPAGATTGQFKIRRIEDILDGKDLTQTLHKHDFYFILIVKKGRGTHEIDFIPYDVHDKVIFILRPGQVHQLHLKKGSTGYLVEFDAEFYQTHLAMKDARWRQASIKNHCPIKDHSFEKLFANLSNMYEEWVHKKKGFADAIQANLDLFFLEYLRQSRNEQGASTASANYQQEHFDAFIELLEKKIVELKNVTQYASLLNLSAYQLNAITKASVGKTVSEMINYQLILEAKRNLLATPNQVRDIADQLGFEDVSYFIRFFKKHTGYTPDGFRKNSR